MHTLYIPDSDQTQPTAHDSNSKFKFYRPKTVFPKLTKIKQRRNPEETIRIHKIRPEKR